MTRESGAAVRGGTADRPRRAQLAPKDADPPWPASRRFPCQARPRKERSQRLLLASGSHPAGDTWESLQPCTLTEGSSSVRLGPSSSRNPPDHSGTAGRCGTEFLNGFSGLGSRPKRPSREDQFVDSALEERVERVAGRHQPARRSASTLRDPAPIALPAQPLGGSHAATGPDRVLR
jgi:hypothetical protein